MKHLQIQKEIDTLKKGLTKKEITQNGALLSSLEAKIKELESQLADETEVITNVQVDEEGTPITKVKKIAEPKIAKAPKETKAPKAPKATPEGKISVEDSPIKIGERVRYFHKKSGEYKEGIVINIKNSYSYADKLIVVIRTDKGEKLETYTHLAEKI